MSIQSINHVQLAFPAGAEAPSRRLLQAELPLVESQALPGYLRFYVKDPAGNQLEFLEPDNERHQETTP